MPRYVQLFDAPWRLAAHTLPLQQFGMVGVVYASIECALSKAMGRQDMYNALIAGALGGSMFALVPSLSNYKNVIPSCTYEVHACGVCVHAH